MDNLILTVCRSRYHRLLYLQVVGQIVCGSTTEKKPRELQLSGLRFVTSAINLTLTYLYDTTPAVGTSRTKLMQRVSFVPAPSLVGIMIPHTIGFVKYMPQKC